MKSCEKMYRSFTFPLQIVLTRWNMWLDVCVSNLDYMTKDINTFDSPETTKSVNH